jgi:geranylgeranyl diphosphate synthase type II
VLTAAGTPYVEAYTDEVSRLVRRVMLDSIPDGEPHRWLYRVARAYPSRPG